MALCWLKNRKIQLPLFEKEYRFCLCFFVSTSRSRGRNIFFFVSINMTSFALLLFFQLAIIPEVIKNLSQYIFFSTDVFCTEINLKSFHEIVISKLSISSQFYLVFNLSRIYCATSPRSPANDFIYYSFIILKFQYFSSIPVV